MAPLLSGSLLQWPCRLLICPLLTFPPRRYRVLGSNPLWGPFWGVYGGFDISEPMTLEHEPTTTLAPGLLWTYQFIATVVLVNLLIAQMADTYGRVTADGVIRWQFERAGLILEYKDGKPPLPPPFNVLCFLYYMGRGAMARCHGAVTGDVPTPAAGFKRVTDAMQQSILARRESACMVKVAVLVAP